jgi:hypothetical protein
MLLLAISCGAQPLLAALSDCGDDLLPPNPTSPASYNCTAITNGIWGAASTWTNGLVPTSLTNATVLIPPNITVTIGNPYTNNAMSNVVVYGSLVFINNGQMRLSTMLVRAGGLLQMGTDASPIPNNDLASISIVDDGPVNTNWDVSAVSHGILNEGLIHMCGAQKTAFVALAGDAAAGTNKLTLATAPSGWNVGDQIVLASTDFVTNWSATHPQLHNEVFSINAISGTSVTLNTNLAYSHTRVESGEQIHVANLTRNVVIQSETDVIANRGHFMTCTNNVVIRNASFYKLGRTDKREVVTDPLLTTNGYANPRARYSLHFHECGPDINLTPGVVTGCVAQDTPGWAFVNHESYVNFTNNVAFDFDGAGFTTENGDEAGSFVNNIAIGGTGDGEYPERRIIFGDQARQDAGDTAYNGEGFWFESPDITVTGNVAAGCKGTGFVWWCAGKWNPDTGEFTGFPRSRVPTGVVPRCWKYDTNEVLISDIPIRTCDNNVAYGCFAGMKLRWVNNGDTTFFETTRGGFTNEIVLAPGYTGLGGATRKDYTLSNCTFWNVENGFHATYANQAYFNNITNVCGSTNGNLGGIGVSCIINESALHFTNLRVTNFLTGLSYANGYRPSESGTIMIGVVQPYFNQGATNNIPNYQLGFNAKNQQFSNTH